MSSPALHFSAKVIGARWVEPLRRCASAVSHRCQRFGGLWLGVIEECPLQSPQGKRSHQHHPCAGYPHRDWENFPGSDQDRDLSRESAESWNPHRGRTCDNKNKTRKRQGAAQIHGRQLVEIAGMSPPINHSAGNGEQQGADDRRAKTFVTPRRKRRARLPWPDRATQSPCG